MTFKNLKIPVENNLAEIAWELERLGYKRDYVTDYIPQSVKCLNGLYQVFSIHTDDFLSDAIETTLAELKEM